MSAVSADYMQEVRSHASCPGLRPFLLLAGNEVAVLERAMSQLQTEMHEKRLEAYELEDKLGADNPPVFAAVQVGANSDVCCLKLHVTRGSRACILGDVPAIHTYSDGGCHTRLAAVYQLAHAACSRAPTFLLRTLAQRHASICCNPCIVADCPSYPVRADQARPGAAQEGLQGSHHQQLEAAALQDGTGAGTEVGSAAT